MNLKMIQFSANDVDGALMFNAFASNFEERLKATISSVRKIG